MLHRIGYCWERAYPYVFALVCVILSWKKNILLTDNTDFYKVLDGIIMLSSIIIGFLGAIMPVILSMKNESKFVKYVFEKDNKNLFANYLKVTVLLGLFDAALSLLMNVRSSFGATFQKNLYYAWLWTTIAFMVSTYRSMSHMISLIFAKDVKEDEMQVSKVSKDRDDELTRKYE